MLSGLFVAKSRWLARGKYGVARTAQSYLFALRNYCVLDDGDLPKNKPGWPLKENHAGKPGITPYPRILMEQDYPTQRGVPRTATDSRKACVGSMD